METVRSRADTAVSDAEPPAFASFYFRTGGGGNIGTEAVVRAPADGYTLLLVGPPHAINAALYDKLNFNFIRKAPPLGGGSPAMYWYGFVFTAGLVALVVAGLAALVPDRLMERVPWLTLTWVGTLCSNRLHNVRSASLSDEDLSQAGRLALF